MKFYIKRGTTQIVKVWKLYSNNVEELAKLTHAQIVEEIDALDPTLIYEGLNIKLRVNENGEKEFGRLSLGMYLIGYSNGTYEIENPHSFKVGYSPMISNPKKKNLDGSEEYRGLQ